MRLVQLQMHVYMEKERNLVELEKKMKKLSEKAPDIVMLGEMFNCPYVTKVFPEYAEAEGGESWIRVSRLAAKYQVYIVAGSMPERDSDGKIYNTAYVFNREGIQIAKHRKIHLFDIHIKGGQKFRESDTLTAGDKCTVFDTEFGRIGLCICFDFRFPELARKMVLDGAKLILVPASFNRTTGPVHWELMFRSRAVDNQCFTAGTSGAQDVEAEYVAWGHSILVSPWGEILEELNEKEGCLIHDISLQDADKIREELPLLHARREDVYQATREARMNNIRKE